MFALYHFLLLHLVLLDSYRVVGGSELSGFKFLKVKPSAFLVLSKFLFPLVGEMAEPLVSSQTCFVSCGSFTVIWKQAFCSVKAQRGTKTLRTTSP